MKYVFSILAGCSIGLSVFGGVDASLASGVLAMGVASCLMTISVIIDDAVEKLKK